MFLSALAVLLATAAPHAAAATVRIGSAELLPPGTALIGPLNGVTRLRIAVTLTPRDPAVLARFAAAVADPSSSEYRRYLTPAQFRRRFGPAPARVAAVRAALRARGLIPGPTAAGGLSIPIRATAAALARAFRIGFDRLRLRDGATAIIASALPALDGAVAGDVQAIVGLGSVSAPHPLRAGAPAANPLERGEPRVGIAARAAPHVATGGPRPCSAAAAAAGAHGAFTADQIAGAYGFGGLYRAGDGGQGVTVAIYELEPYDGRDIATYQACFGSSATIANVPVDGGAGSGAGSGEAALDIEQLVGLAPRANVLVYEAPNSNSSAPGSGPYDAFAAIVNQNRARVATVSWGQCEALEGANARAESTLFQQAAAQGQTIISATGDSGSEDCDAGGPLANTSLAVDDPAGQPFVTGVGGTTLQALGPPPSERVWNSGGNLGGLLGLAAGAGGGGPSALWRMPAYQEGAAPSLGVIGADASRGCGGLCRQVPDVTADADPSTGYEIYYNGAGAAGGAPVGWQPTGGTSGGAPLWAAVMALADASRGCAGRPVGFANTALYALAASGPGRYFHDVTSGSNDLAGTHGGLYSARPGYDMASGLGSPDAAALAGALCTHALPATVPSRIDSSRGSSVSVRLGAGGASAVRFSARGLPPGLRLNRSSGVVSGRPRRLGGYTVHLTVTGGGASQAVSFAWVIAAAPRLSAVSLRGSRLSFRIGAAPGGPALVRLTLRGPAGRRLLARAVRASATGAGGTRLAAAAALARGVLVIRLLAPARLVTIELPPGSLSVPRRGARRAGRLRVTAADVSGGVTTLAARP